MAQKNHDRLKQLLLLGFVGISILLIGMTWADGLIADQPATPSYYRGSFQMDENIYLTVTAEAQQYELTGTPSAPDHDAGHGAGQGHGQGSGQHEQEEGH